MKAIHARTYFGLGIVILLFIFINTASSQLFKSIQVDLTSEKLYTLSQGTKKILHKTSDPIKLKYYFSSTDTASIPGLNGYGKNVEDLLRRFANESPKITLEVFDTRYDSEEAEWAEKYGLRSLAISGEGNAFLGLVIANELGDESVIPYLDPQRETFLEYDICKTITSLNQSQQLKLGLYSKLPLKGAAPNPLMGSSRENEPWYFTMELENLYQVSYLQSLEEIDPELDALLLIHPKDLNEQEQFQFDQFLLSGKNAVILADPFSEGDAPPANPQNPMMNMSYSRESALPKTLTTNGISLDKAKVILDRQRATQVQTGPGQVVDYYVWLSMNSQDLNQDDVVTAQLETLLLPYSGYFVTDVSKTKHLKIENLLQSSNTAFKGESSLLMFGATPDRIAKAYQQGDENLNIALRVNGKLKTAFPDGPPNKKEVNKDLVVLKEGVSESNLILIADTDFIANRYSLNVANFLGNMLVTSLNDNINFLFNALESVSGDDSLISIRSRGTFSRPFTLVKEIEAKAAEKWAAEEQNLSAKVNQMEQRISQIMQSRGDDSKVISADQNLINDLKKLRLEKVDAAKRLREVRKNLRQEKETLGNQLFLINTFLVPSFILLYGLFQLFRRRELHV